MDKEKGFTLIELLAVIVILAVIALIAVPVILSLVDKSRRKAAEESAILYVDTIENMLMINNIENTDGKTYKVRERMVVDEKDKVILNLEIKGDVPYSGVNNEIKINSGFIETANLRFNSYYVHYEMDMTTKKFKTCTSQKGFLEHCEGTEDIKPEPPTSVLDTIKLGDYISYTPKNTTFTILKEDTGYESDQTLNPSELTLWRVIRKNEDKTVDLISADVSSTKIAFKLRAGYNNYIGILNKIAKQYETDGITAGSRHMGYDGKIMEYCTDSSSCETEDNAYRIDEKLVKEALGDVLAKAAGGTKNTMYWLASRTGGTYSCSSCMYVRYYLSTGKLTYDSIDGLPKSVRPIVVLKSTVKITGGNGTESSPYTLGIS